MLSQITSPTEGSIKINGRIASLLEVGTGFHPELTGRENIFMNGAILGMTHAEIDSKVDQIIEFSEIGEHIDTPVKRYSSGMYVRLAFAVAAHLDSKILIADEVLAVGDAAFQKKALGKMNELSSGQGRTVLFVSHNMAQIKNLCNKGIVLNKGKILRQDDDINLSIKSYLGLDNALNTEFIEWKNQDYKNDEVLPLSIEVLDENNQKVQASIDYEKTYKIKLKADVKIKNSNLGCYYMAYVGSERIYQSPFNFMNTEIGEYEYIMTLPPKMFIPKNTYRFCLAVSIQNEKYVVNPYNDNVFVNIPIESSDSQFDNMN